MNANTTLVRIHGVLEENSRRLCCRRSSALAMAYPGNTTVCSGMLRLRESLSNNPTVLTTSLKVMRVSHAVVNPYD